MTDRIEIEGLNVDARLAAFVDEKVLPGTGVDRGAFWAALSQLIHEFGPRNRALLAVRDEMQAKIDARTAASVAASEKGNSSARATSRSASGPAASRPWSCTDA